MYDTNSNPKDSMHSPVRRTEQQLSVLPDLDSNKTELIPCVRYGSSSDSEPTQFPTLRPVHAPIPEEATTVSPIYYLTEEQLKRQDDRTNPYAVSGDHPIAKYLQDECETARRVLYPVIVESDSEVNLDEMASGIVKFVEEVLDVDPGHYTVWYSGGRSIHAHVATFVDASGWDQIKQIAEEFNESEGSDVELDTGIYKPKQQFRLPGVEHQEKEGLKVQIEPEWPHDRIFREAHSRDRDVPETFFDVLAETVPALINPLDQSELLDGESVEDCGVKEPQQVPMHQREQPPSDPDLRPDYYQHNAHVVSPYANAEADDLHSVTVVRVMGESFRRAGEYFAPCDVLGAIGGDGEYRVFDDQPVARPVKLSGHDIQKWDYERVDYVVILGGRSRRSRILEVDKVEAMLIAGWLESEGRQAALRQLEDWNYDTGSTGMNGTGSSEGSVNPSEAAEIQRRIEREGIEAVDNEYDALFRVACRLLRISGWDRTWEWFREQLGDQFDPEKTHYRLSKIVDCYSEDYDHVAVPPQPHHEQHLSLYTAGGGLTASETAVFESEGITDT